MKEMTEWCRGEYSCTLIKGDSGWRTSFCSSRNESEPAPAVLRPDRAPRTCARTAAMAGGRVPVVLQGIAVA